MSKELTAYVEDMNSLRRIFGDPDLAIPTNADECEVFFKRLESDLSPENLHCDGEITRAAAMKKKRFYDKVWSQLEAVRGSKRQQYA